MTPLATVLYEDSMRPGAGGSYPLHDLVLRMVEDEINGESWRLHRGVAKNPRKGVGNILNDVKRTALLAGKGALCILVDMDRIAEHLNMPGSATEAAIVERLRAMSDAPDRLWPFFLRPNVEGLLRSIETCDRAVPPVLMRNALNKRLNERDLVFNEVKKPERPTVRACVRQAQPGLDALARHLSALVSSMAPVRGP